MDKFSNYDKKGQDKVVPILNELFSKCKDVNIEQHYQDKGRIDIFVTATTHSNITKRYAIECKDRWFESTTYSEIMLNISCCRACAGHIGFSSHGLWPLEHGLRSYGAWA